MLSSSDDPERKLLLVKSAELRQRDRKCGRLIQGCGEASNGIMAISLAALKTMAGERDVAVLQQAKKVDIVRALLEDGWARRSLTY